MKVPYAEMVVTWVDDLTGETRTGISEAVVRSRHGGEEIYRMLPTTDGTVWNVSESAIISAESIPDLDDVEMVELWLGT